ncbi:metallophosphoesterase [Oceanobacillus massiliensis]|uniref:metallophosphoesterase n=1 Tax=Oceanobacillus massiliensis TaxID=1465765 RepID=UPI00028A114E|nr:metallophosphoesterase [Oceanobacillus massiliensis]
MRTFYTSDIHGDFKSFMELLQYVEYNPAGDKLIIGGDMINRGSQSAQVLQWAKQHHESFPDMVHVLIGNHEEMMIWFMNELSPMWMEFGGDQTISSFKKVFGSDRGWDTAEEYAIWLETLPLIYEDEYGIYTHAGINIGESKENQPRDIVWINQKELLELNEDILQKWTEGKYIYRGHNPVSTVHKKGQFVQCDLGNGTFQAGQAALALVDVKKGCYYRCEKDGQITERVIEDF